MASTEKRNRDATAETFFILPSRFCEAGIMKALIGKVPKLGADSIAWVQDGIFVSQNMNKEAVFQAFSDAVLQSIGIHTAAIQIG